MIIGKAVTLLPFDEKYLDVVHEWINQPDVRRGTGSEGPVSTVEHRRWYEQVMGDPQSRIFIIGRGQGAAAVPVGMVALRRIEHRAHSAEYSIYVADQESRRKGLACEATVLILRFGFMGLGLNRIYLRVMQCNSAAVHLYEKLGFVLEGVAREDAFLDGRFESSVCYSMLSREFQQKFGHETDLCPTPS
jgi:RimJ/RimL family protein N-acetyltransferase